MRCALSSRPGYRVQPGKPDVPAPQFGHNQLRYMWERGAQYATWRHAQPSSGDYWLGAEVWGHGGKVDAIQVYVLDATGQIAYCRLFNSHHFGDLPMETAEVLDLIARTLAEDLKKKPEQIFPPYGVG